MRRFSRLAAVVGLIVGCGDGDKGSPVLDAPSGVEIEPASFPYTSSWRIKAGDPRRFCPVCDKDGSKSHVYRGGTTATMMLERSHYDEEGESVHYDPNWYWTEFACSLGHRWSVTQRMGEIVKVRIGDEIFTDLPWTMATQPDELNGDLHVDDTITITIDSAAPDPAKEDDDES